MVTTPRHNGPHLKPHASKEHPYLSSIVGELKVNLWDHIGILVHQKGERLPTLLLSTSPRPLQETLLVLLIKARVQTA